MERSRKEEIVSELKGALDNAEIVIVTRHNGLTVAEATDLRRSIRDAGADFRVVKNRLVLRALENTGMESIAGLFRGPSAVATSRDPVPAAKAAVDYAKKNDKLVIVGGAMDGKPLDAEEIRTVAQLPSLDELRARLLGMIATPATRIACILQVPGTRLARVLDAHATGESGD